ncbi:MAG: hypothetical protein K6C95_04290 [Lachnospiraceae bacterium]|nr:hypothetical protein [Lachnospiraceae bacterium]
MGSRTLNSKRNIIVGSVSSCLIPLLAMVINSATVRYFGVEYIGLTGVFRSVLQVLNLTELGFSSAVIVNLYKPLKDDDVAAVRGILAYYRRVYRIIGIAILISGMIVCPLLDRLIGDTGGIGENIYILYLLYLTDTAMGFLLFGYKEALFHAAQRLDITKAVHIIIYIGKSILQLAAIAVLRNFYAYAAAIAVGTVFYNLSLNILSKKKFPQYYPDGRIDDDTRKNVREQVVGVSVSRILGATRESYPMIAVNSFLGLHTAGQYSNYCLIFSTVLGFFLIITKAVQASIGNSIVSETAEKNYADLTRMEFLQNAFITACAAYLVSLYQPFMKIWMGSDLVFPVPVMMLFVLYFYILAMGEVRNAYFSALGYWWKARWIFIVEALMNVILITGMGKLFGVAGIILATIITVFFVNYIGVTNLLFREYFGSGRNEFYRNRIIYTVAAFIICGAVWSVCGLIPLEGAVGIIVRLAVCTLIIVILLPGLMFLSQRKNMTEAAAFVRQIIRA